MMISGAALLGLAALAIFVQRRRQIAAKGNDEQQQEHGFEMMNDKSAVSA